MGFAWLFVGLCRLRAESYMGNGVQVWRMTWEL